MPFVDKVHLVVSNSEQVPEWLNAEAVHIVLHKDIIPEKILPTFNSTTIEMYLHKIPSLAEHFIYSNDDMFAVKSTEPADFFTPGGIPKYQLIRRKTASNIFRMQCLNSYRLATRLSKTPERREYFYIAHSMDPMLKSACDEIHEKAGDEILRRCTKFREPWNFTQYLFPIYSLITERGVTENASFRYLSVKGGIEQAVEEILSGESKIICVNDASIKNFESDRERLVEVFEKRFPGKSRFEK